MIRSAIVLPTSTGTSTARTMLHGDSYFVISSFASAIVGFIPIVIVSHPNRGDTIVIKYTIESPAMPFRTEFMSDPVYPPSMADVQIISPQSFHEARQPLPRASVPLSVYGENAQAYTSSPLVGLQILFEV